MAGWPDVNPPPKQEQNTHTKDCFGQIKVWAVDRFHALVWWLGGTWPSGNPTPYTNKQNNNMNNNVFVGGLEKTCLLLLFFFMVWWPGGLVAWWPGGLVAWCHQTTKPKNMFMFLFNGLVAWWPGGLMAW